MSVKTLTMPISREVEKKLLVIRERSGLLDAPSIFLRSVALYNKMLEHVAEGGTVNLVNKDGTGAVLRLP